MKILPSYLQPLDQQKDRYQSLSQHPVSPLHLGLHGCLGNIQLLGNLLVLLSFNHFQQNNLPALIGQRIQRLP